MSSENSPDEDDPGQTGPGTEGSVAASRKRMPRPAGSGQRREEAGAEGDREGGTFQNVEEEGRGDGGGGHTGPGYLCARAHRHGVGTPREGG